MLNLRCQPEVVSFASQLDKPVPETPRNSLWLLLLNSVMLLVVKTTGPEINLTGTKEL